MQDLIERLSNAIDKALAETEGFAPASSSTTRELAYAAQLAMTALVEHPELADVDYGEPDPAENERVSAALAQGGSIREGAKVLGVSTHRMKHLIIQHRVEWPRGWRERQAERRAQAKDPTCG